MNTKTEVTHTPTPWEASGKYFQFESKDNQPFASSIKVEGTRIINAYGSSPEIALERAEFIVRAVNSHEALLLACQRALEHGDFSEAPTVVQRLKEAIAQADREQKK